ncbi:MAG: hypothetical protein OQK46_02480 [Gammaproteobacteria bacterium]|nr:hypothetical protein [Gammaproteobacteria bacterium]
MNISDIKNNLQQLHEILKNHQSIETAWLEDLIELCDAGDELALYRELNSKHMWGGAGSVANEALADNTGSEDWIWNAEIQQFRELMIELGQHLMQRGNAYPDISSWLLAFNNWNQSGQ